jgi:hypothetical protein
LPFKLRYLYFWPNFKPEDFLFTRILENILGEKIEIVVSNKYPVDLEIVSVFYFKSDIKKFYYKSKSKFSSDAYWDYLSMVGRGFKNEYSNTAKKRIWYTGENLRPPIEKFDGLISFEPNCTQSNNLFLPYWMVRLNWGLGKSEFEIQPDVSELTKTRKPIKKKFDVCSFSNRKETSRQNLVKILDSKFDIHLFGAAYNKPVKSKFDVSSDYIMQICNENDLYPNYVTEKIQEAWLARNVPIWMGLDTMNWFNKEALIDLTSLSVDGIQEVVSKLTMDELMYKQTLPILNSVPSLEKTFEFFKKFINS